MATSLAASSFSKAMLAYRVHTVYAAQTQYHCGLGLRNHTWYVFWDQLTSWQLSWTLCEGAYLYLYVSVHIYTYIHIYRHTYVCAHLKLYLIPYIQHICIGVHKFILPETLAHLSAARGGGGEVGEASMGAFGAAWAVTLKQGTLLVSIALRRRPRHIQGLYEDYTEVSPYSRRMRALAGAKPSLVPVVGALCAGRIRRQLRLVRVSAFGWSRKV